MRKLQKQCVGDTKRDRNSVRKLVTTGDCNIERAVDHVAGSRGAAR